MVADSVISLTGCGNTIGLLDPDTKEYSFSYSGSKAAVSQFNGLCLTSLALLCNSQIILLSIYRFVFIDLTIIFTFQEVLVLRVSLIALDIAASDS